MILAVVAGVLIAAVPAFAQDTTSGYTTTTPTVTTPTTSTTPATTTPRDPSTSEDSGVEGTAKNGAAPSSGSGGGELAHTGSNTWELLAIGGVLALGSALLLARERQTRRSR